MAEALEGVGSLHEAGERTVRDPVSTSGGAEQPKSRARGKNWTTDETLKLVQDWRTEVEKPRDKGESAAVLNSAIYEIFKVLCGGSTLRSEKAVTDKKNTLPIAYKFIVGFNNNRVIGSTDMEIAVFNALKNVLGGDDSVEPATLMSSTPLFERDDVTAPHHAFYRDEASVLVSGEDDYHGDSDEFATEDENSEPNARASQTSVESIQLVQQTAALFSPAPSATIKGKRKRKEMTQPTNGLSLLPTEERPY
ncbi:Hypothetical protein PHPALM_10523 [Phytophthora palmivora]|uniref:Uncharacterized protein n=1 Tax=Phytophthora palmivora TaxID=4796 RepID=A0A2P4Y4I5_9STRA|nr:Hypothetical protein PHPALM_10523 [Phytophthora palmivora]